MQLRISHDCAPLLSAGERGILNSVVAGGIGLTSLVRAFHAFEHGRDPRHIPSQCRDRRTIIRIRLSPQVRDASSYVDDESPVSLIGAKNLLPERR